MATGTNPAYYQQHYTLIPVCCCCPLGSIIPSYSARCRVASVVLSFSPRSLERHLKCVCDTRHLQHPTFPPGPLLDIKNASKLRINLWVCVNCFSQCLFFFFNICLSQLALGKYALYHTSSAMLRERNRLRSSDIYTVYVWVWARVCMCTIMWLHDIFVCLIE